MILPSNSQSRKNPILLSVRGVTRDGQGRVLILRRSSLCGSGAHEWELPGGKVENGEAIDIALIREFQEETNLGMRVGNFLGAVETVLSDRRILYVCFAVEVISGEIALSNEHDAFEWFDDHNDGNAFVIRPATAALLDIVRN